MGTACGQILWLAETAGRQAFNFQELTINK
jgi:hypothetical protein